MPRMSDAQPPLPRVLPLRGATNFRDLGGYRGHGGRPLRWRRLFRSDQLGDLTGSDHQALRRLGVAASFDFRGADERAAAPYDVPGLVQHALPIEPTVAQRMQEISGAGRALTAKVVQGLMEDLYRGLVNHRAERFSQLFTHLLNAEAPLVFHCTAGKDRTGVAAALILLALGVPRATVMQDFLLTNEVFKPPWVPRPDVDPAVRRALWGVQASYLQAAFDVLDGDHGGPEPYLRQKVGLNDGQLELLAMRYLEPG